MDGHSSHYTLELLEFAWANDTIILGYPLHCTHALQGLDIVCFAWMKEARKEEIHKFEECHRKVIKGDFTKVFSKAFLQPSPNPLSKLHLKKQGFGHLTPK